MQHSTSQIWLSVLKRQRDEEAGVYPSQPAAARAMGHGVSSLTLAAPPEPPQWPLCCSTWVRHSSFDSRRTEECVHVWAEWREPLHFGSRWIGEPLAHPNTCIPFSGPSQQWTTERVSLCKRTNGLAQKALCVEGRRSRTSFNLCEQDHCRDCTLDPGRCSSPQFPICAVLVGFQLYKSILRSCFAHSYKPYLFSWCCGVRVWWGRSLQSVTSCGLLSDSSSVHYIPHCSHSLLQSHLLVAILV